MKRIISFILALICILPLCACASQKEEIYTPVNFYYRARIVSYNSEDGIVTPEVREGKGYENDSLSLINQYLKGPVSEHCVSPFPARVEALELTANGNDVHIVLNEQFCMLTGHDLTLACVCLSKTLLDLTHAEQIEISVKDRLIDGKASISMHKDNLLFIDDITDVTTVPG